MRLRRPPSAPIFRLRAKRVAETRRSVAEAVTAAVLAVCAALLCLPSARPAARAAQPPPFFFIQLSDPQFGMFSDNKTFVQETINFEFAIATVNRLRPAFVVVTGDLVNKAGDPDQIREYHRIAAKLDPTIALYNVAGNHDVENAPTSQSIAAYVKEFGPDHYTFKYGDLVGIVLNSSLIHAPHGTPDEAAAQQRWLQAELPRARSAGARPLLIVQHHPWFLESSSEPDQYFNIPLERRLPLLAMFHEAGVGYLVAGHYHRNAVARDGEIEMITTGPVGKPLGGAQSGLRVFIVRNGSITHRYYSLGEIPDRIDVSASATSYQLPAFSSQLSASSFHLPASSSQPQLIAGSRSCKPETRNWQLETGNWKLEAGSGKPEAGSGKLEAGSWKLEAGSWKLEAGSWKRRSW